jgi:hypothetical protein
MRPGVVWIKPQNRFELFLGAIEGTGRGQGFAQIEMGFNIVRVVCDGRPQMENGLRKIAGCCQKVAQISSRFRQIGLQPDSLAESGFGSLPVTFSQLGETQKIVGRGKLGVKGNGLPQGSFRLIEPAPLKI